ncbi:MAG: hypothetical protein SVK08_02480 [Halobacteriota archaeon]|nr:hypothetical protein [Halobacteriota archaeon]
MSDRYKIQKIYRSTIKIDNRKDPTDKLEECVDRICEKELQGKAGVRVEIFMGNACMDPYIDFECSDKGALVKFMDEAMSIISEYLELEAT